MIRRGELLESAEVFGNFYGTAHRFLEEARDTGKDLLLDIDVQGAAQVKAKIQEAVSIFILPPSREVLEWRLRHRSQDSEEVIWKRLQDAGREIHGYDQYDYILINNQLERSAEQLKAIVLTDRWRWREEPQAKSTAKTTEYALAESCRKRAYTNTNPTDPGKFWRLMDAGKYQQR